MYGMRWVKSNISTVSFFIFENNKFYKLDFNKSQFLLKMAEHAFPDPRQQAMDYLEKHKLYKLFDILGAKLAFTKPDDPNEFLKAEIQSILDLKAAGQKYSIFKEVDIEALFSTFDLTQRGYITPLQYEKGNFHIFYRPICYLISKNYFFTAILVLGINKQSFPTPKASKIDKKTFVNYM